MLSSVPETGLQVKVAARQGPLCAALVTGPVSGCWVKWWSQLSVAIRFRVCKRIHCPGLGVQESSFLHALWVGYIHSLLVCLARGQHTPLSVLPGTEPHVWADTSFWHLQQAAQHRPQIHLSHAVHGNITHWQAQQEAEVSTAGGKRWSQNSRTVLPWSWKCQCPRIVLSPHCHQSGPRPVSTCQLLSVLQAHVDYVEKAQALGQVSLQRFLKLPELKLTLPFLLTDNLLPIQSILRPWKPTSVFCLLWEPEE